jgi:DNA polymerase (family 10)
MTYRTGLLKANKLKKELLKVFDDVIICGSIRRKEKYVNDIDIAVRYNGPLLIEHIETLIPKATIIRGGEFTVTFIYEGVQVNCYKYSGKFQGAMTLFLTGPGTYNISLRRKAIQKRWKLSQYGLFNLADGKCIAAKNEEDIYSALDEEYVPPEKRKAS